MQHYVDAMTIVGEFGKPDYFITFTANPNWPEVTGSLLPNQTAEERDDIICKVFQGKYKSLLSDISDGHVLGKIYYLWLSLSKVALNYLL